MSFGRDFIATCEGFFVVDVDHIMYNSFIGSVLLLMIRLQHRYGYFVEEGKHIWKDDGIQVVDDKGYHYDKLQHMFKI